MLNEGGAATRSDTLVVDGTSVGAGGATGSSCGMPAARGDLTVGDGILVVQGLSDRAAAGAVRACLGAPVVRALMNIFSSAAATGTGTATDWYLRSIYCPRRNAPVTP